MIESQEKKWKISPAMSYVKYSEPKILLYLSIAIFLLVFFIFYVWNSNRVMNDKLSKIETYINNKEKVTDDLETSLTNTITTEINKLLNSIKTTSEETKSEINEQLGGTEVGLL